ncbi:MULTISPECIES: hypothetical protein [unclassified Psychrobacillus]|jgi:hypothetical protein|uniref:hypothetical protein n=1 Tax=unclassified Psychrobacillus TaxID=2636677 RepID=UPI0012470744|nr:hypothetical protein [Psychrobacillus sp. AK 1817]QEY21493.1 hypothetical protein D0S48_12905 [Psychrobacillus sp. AK 1817]QGM32024.1 hypothetical protein GI482_17420 [Bacillus sp. N3536]
MNNHHMCHSCGQTKGWGQSCGCRRQLPAAEPIVCPPQYRVSDSFVPRMQPVIQPIVNVNREHIVNVPQYFVTESNETVVVPGVQQAYPVNNPSQGGSHRGFFSRFR